MLPAPTRIVAYLFILCGCIFFLDAIEEDRVGVASAVAPGTTVSYHTVSRADSPELFEGLMMYQWIRATLAVCGGPAILGIRRHYERLDPFSPKFTGRDALEQCERKLDTELRKKHSPIR